MLLQPSENTIQQQNNKSREKEGNKEKRNKDFGWGG
jgi:hypothetical protein